MNNSVPIAIGIRIILFVLPFIFFCNFVSYSQDDYRWYGRKETLYVSAGFLKGKRIVSDMEVFPKDSINQQIHVKLELLKDWVIVDSAEFDLFLDTTKQEWISFDDRKYEAIQYRTMDSGIRINFEKPQKHAHTASNGMEFIYWSCTYATVNYSSKSRFKKYERVLKVYFEK